MSKKMDPLKAIISQNLQNLRLKKGWQQEYVGELMGGYYSYQRLEQGLTALKIEDAIKLSRIFDVPIEEIWRDENEDHSGVVQDMEREPYHRKRNAVSMSVLIDGDEISLEKQIDLLKSVNKLLVKENS